MNATWIVPVIRIPFEKALFQIVRPMLQRLVLVAFETAFIGFPPPQGRLDERLQRHERREPRDGVARRVRAARADDRDAVAQVIGAPVDGAVDRVMQREVDRRRERARQPGPSPASAATLSPRLRTASPVDVSVSIAHSPATISGTTSKAARPSAHWIMIRNRLSTAGTKK